MGDAGSLKGDDAAVETFSSEVVKGVLPSRHVASDVQAGVPYFLRLTASNSLGYGEYGDTIAVAKAAEVPGSPGNLSAGVALHVDEVSQPLCSRVHHIVLSSQVLHPRISLKTPSKIYATRILVFMSKHDFRALRALFYFQVQTVTVAATHRDEVQTITTAAPAIVSVQLMSTSADEGDTVAGYFALQFAERQTVSSSKDASVYICQSQGVSIVQSNSLYRNALWTNSSSEKMTILLRTLEIISP